MGQWVVLSGVMRTLQTSPERNCSNAVRGASFTVHYEVFDDEALSARASTTCVTYDFATARPRRFTPEERAVLDSFIDDFDPADGRDG